MQKIKKILLTVLLIFVFIPLSAKALPKTIKKEIIVETKDCRVIKATLSYIEIKNVKKYPTVLLLHSLGYSSTYWGNLVQELNDAGYAVIAMDFRGHGKSIYNTSFQKKSWIYFNEKEYQKFPGDVVLLLDKVNKQYKNLSPDNFAIVGADIGANAAVLAAKELKIKPKTIVLISPTRDFKGLYIPVAMTDLKVPMLSIVSRKDRFCVDEEKELAKFSQSGFYSKKYPEGGTGMLMLKINPEMSQDIVKWIIKYLK